LFSSVSILFWGENTGSFPIICHITKKTQFDHYNKLSRKQYIKLQNHQCPDKGSLTTSQAGRKQGSELATWRQDQGCGMYSKWLLWVLIQSQDI
jgi:hypothetical protein